MANSKILLTVFFIQVLDPKIFVESIIQGKAASPGEFSFMVSIQPADARFHHCGGFIIHPHYVLTAGHCVDGLAYEDLKVVSGTTDLSKDSFKDIHEITQLYSYDNFTLAESWKNDIALIKVKQPFTVNNNTSVAKLPSLDAEIPVNTTATVTGFGRRFLYNNPSINLRKAEVAIREAHLCVKKFQKLNANESAEARVMCAQGSDGAGVCKGDSGGALIVNGTVVGIASVNNNDCDNATRKHPSLFTKISKYLTWINAHIASN